MSVCISLLFTAALLGCAQVEAADSLPRIERLDPRFDKLVPSGAKLERIADGFGWAEGPAWNAATEELFFSDVETNHMHAWSEKNGTRTVLEKAGYVRSDPFTGREPGSNGIAFDAQGRVVFCQHGERRISRLEADATRTVLVDRYQGKRLNSPNDLVYSRAGDLFFTDPPFGLPGTYDDPERELSFTGVYRLKTSGELELLTRELEGPNGIGLSPDERTLYVANNSPTRPLWMAYELRADGTLGPGRELFDAMPFTATRKGFPDGLKVGKNGHLFAAGPEGIYVLTAEGEHLGTLFFGQLTANCAFDEQGRLYVTADSAIYRLTP
jgi:gluconolactonase